MQLGVAKPLAANSVDSKAFDNFHRLNDMSMRTNPPKPEDPEGGAQDAHRFSTRQDAASKNPGRISDGRFASALKSFLW